MFFRRRRPSKASFGVGLVVLGAWLAYDQTDRAWARAEVYQGTVVRAYSRPSVTLSRKHPRRYFEIRTSTGDVRDVRVYSFATWNVARPGDYVTKSSGEQDPHVSKY